MLPEGRPGEIMPKNSQTAIMIQEVPRRPTGPAPPAPEERRGEEILSEAAGRTAIIFLTVPHEVLTAFSVPVRRAT